MIKVLIVDDDETMRSKALRCLARPDVELFSASNGKLGLEQARQFKPDMVVCDVDMPGMNGFEVLEALRADEELAGVQVMLLTAHTSRNSIRLGMTLGADDYLTKPFTDEELVSAFEGLLKKRGRLEALLDSAVKDREDSLRRMFAHNFDGGAADRVTLDQPKGKVNGPLENLGDGAVLYSGIRAFTSLAEKLSAPEVESLLCAYFERACAPVQIHGGSYLHMLGDGLVAVFIDEPGSSAPPACRAMLAATAMRTVSGQFQSWIDRNFPGRGLPEFSAGYGISYGPLTVSRTGADARAAGIPTGDTANLASWLEGAGESRGWTVSATALAVAQAGGEVQVGEKSALTWAAKNMQVEACEVVGAALPREALHVAQRDIKTMSASGYARSLERTVAHTALQTIAQVHLNVKENAQVAARAVKDALGDKLISIKNHKFESDAPPPKLAGFQLLRRIGTGGMSSIYLGKGEPDGNLFVLKVIDSTAQDAQQMTRFIREYSLISAIRHPNIIRIYNQGFSESHAYIAMEYFENGDLRRQMGKPFAHRAVLDAAVQIARALAVIHGLGIVHRDLKPENLMVRADGSLALADFGIAKGRMAPDHKDFAVTQVGEMLGTPSYMSPEQVASEEATAQSDLYSLGIILFEMLAGERPYNAADLLSMMHLHFHAPTPLLPPAAAAFQPLIDRLMQKQRTLRYASAEELLGDLLVFPL